MDNRGGAFSIPTIQQWFQPPSLQFPSLFGGNNRPFFQTSVPCNTETLTTPSVVQQQPQFSFVAPTQGQDAFIDHNALLNDIEDIWSKNHCEVSTQTLALPSKAELRRSRRLKSGSKVSFLFLGWFLL